MRATRFSARLSRIGRVIFVLWALSFVALLVIWATSKSAGEPSVLVMWLVVVNLATGSAVALVALVIRFADLRAEATAAKTAAVDLAAAGLGATTRE